MPNSPKKPSERKRVIGFRLSETEYQTLVGAARLEKRKMADLVYLIVTEALEGYAKRLIPVANTPSAKES